MAECPELFEGDCETPAWCARTQTCRLEHVLKIAPASKVGRWTHGIVEPDRHGL